MLRGQGLELSGDILRSAQRSAEDAQATFGGGEARVADPKPCAIRRCRQGRGLHACGVPHTGPGRVEADVRLKKQVMLKPVQKMCNARWVRSHIHIIQKGPHTLVR